MAETPLQSKYRPPRLALALLPPFLASCVALTTEPRALLLQADGAIRVQSIPCGATSMAAPAAPSDDTATMLDPEAIRILTWNIHKEGDPGWQRDLAQFANASDVVLLQEVMLQDSLRAAIEDAGLRWVMASSFLWYDDDIGVLTAARAAPRASCTQRTFEPLLGLPKSAVLSFFPLAGGAPTLAVANVHAINFTLSLGAYREQLAAIGNALATHRGPIVFGGDLNTWSDARAKAVAELAAHLGLTEIELANDRRSLFLGKPVDHLYVRDLTVTTVQALAVASSDHNPVAATLRYAPQTRSRVQN